MGTRGVHVSHRQATHQNAAVIAHTSDITPRLRRRANTSVFELGLELELIQTQMAQKPMLRAEVYAHAMRASQNRKKEVRREKEV